MKIPNPKQYLEEKAIWTQNGRPYRTSEQMAELFNICRECENFQRFSDGVGQCQICGCFIKRNSKHLNKLAFATTSCPLEEPKWVAEKGFTTILDEQTSDNINKKIAQYKPGSPPNQQDCGCG